MSFPIIDATYSRFLLGSLIYLAIISRKNITFAIGCDLRYMAKP
jgi:hypothetical protein